MRKSISSRRANATRLIGGVGLVAVIGLAIALGLRVDDAGAAKAPTPIATPEEQGLPPELQAVEGAAFGDLEDVVERRVIRFLTVFSRGQYFIDRGRQRGVTYELAQRLEKYVNEHLERGHLKVHVLMLPVARDEIIDALAEGYGDIAAANLTITPARQERVDFLRPWGIESNEILVTSQSVAKLAGVDDLSGREVHVRRGSSYYESLQALNGRFDAEGRPPVGLVMTEQRLEDDDLLEMVNADLIPMIVVDSHKAEFWAQIFANVKLQPHVKLRDGSDIAWAVRKGTPELQKLLNGFVKKHRRGTLTGNVILNRYLSDTKWVENSLVEEDLERFEATMDYFKKYGDKYDFDWLMIAAQAYQESRLDQSARSAAGAVGIMQILPSTAADSNVGIKNVESLENNIHAGVKYLRFIRDRYFSDPGLDDLNATLLSFAAYNAGPGRVRKLRAETAEKGLDPNQWLDNVEVIAAKRIGRETVQYVANIYKYYVSYRMALERAPERFYGR